MDRMIDREWTVNAGAGSDLELPPRFRYVLAKSILIWIDFDSKKKAQSILFPWCPLKLPKDV